MADARRAWGVLATGGIARKFVSGLAGSDQDKVVAVASRDLVRAKAFATDFGIARAYGSYEELLLDTEVAFVYIAVPHPQHVGLVETAAAARKHVLCEKPLAVNIAEAQRAVEACRQAHVALVENFMYRFNPQTDRLLEIIRSGALGKLHRLSASFSFRAPAGDGRGRLWAPELAGGGILDVGCYPISIARLVAGAVDGQSFTDPESIQGAGTLTEQGVDATASCILKFSNGLVADCHTSLMFSGPNDLRIWGSRGELTVTWPYNPSRGGKASIIRWRDADGEHTESLGTELDPFVLGAAATGLAAEAESREHPAMAIADSLGQQRTLDTWRAAVGVRYPFEKKRPLPVETASAL